MDTDNDNTDDVHPHNESTENMNTEFPTLSKAEMLNHLRTWLATYAELVSGVQMLAVTTIEFDESSRGLDAGSHWLEETSQTHVDALLRLRQDVGGESRVVGDYVEGAPELVVKMFDGVARSAMHRRKLAYKKMGITESIIVNEEGTAPWYISDGSPMYSNEEEVVSGAIFPGLGLDQDHFYEDDLSAQLSQLRERVGSVRPREFEEMRGASE